MREFNLDIIETVTILIILIFHISYHILDLFYIKENKPMLNIIWNFICILFFAILLYLMSYLILLNKIDDIEFILFYLMIVCILTFGDIIFMEYKVFFLLLNITIFMISIIGQFWIGLTVIIPIFIIFYSIFHLILEI